jgi:hypothetical protein
LLDWVRVEYEIAKPSNKFLAVIDFDSDTWVGAGSVGDGDRCLETHPHQLVSFSVTADEQKTDPSWCGFQLRPITPAPLKIRLSQLKLGL